LNFSQYNELPSLILTIATATNTSYRADQVIIFLAELNAFSCKNLALALSISLGARDHTFRRTHANH
jgi:hypothetical protein